MVTKAKAAPKQQRKQMALPQGFRSTSGGDFPPVKTLGVGETFQGIVQEIRGVEIMVRKQKKTTRIMSIAQKDTGEIFSFWESAGLKGLFEQAKPGDEVFIGYNGLVNLKGGNRFHDYTSGILGGEAPKTAKKKRG